MNYNELLFFVGMLLVGFSYAAVGHGGASGYIALFVLFGFAPIGIKPLILMLNIGVASISFYQYYKQGFFKVQLLFYFALGSVPMAFMGAKLSINDHYYRIIMACFLIFSGLFLLKTAQVKQLKTVIPFNRYIAFFVGAAIGFVSGIIGVGGGIFLSPFLLLLGWATLKETAAVSSLFIVINSFAGILGLSKLDILSDRTAIIGCMLALLAGFIGAKWGAIKSNNYQLKILLAIVLLAAAIKMIS